MSTRARVCPRAARAGCRGRADPLTSRELEVLQLVAGGATNGEIAQKLWVTEQTVKFHLSNVYRKLEVGNRTEASHYAHVNGLVSRRRTGCVLLIRSGMGGRGRHLETGTGDCLRDKQRRGAQASRRGAHRRAGMARAGASRARRIARRRAHRGYPDAWRARRIEAHSRGIRRELILMKGPEAAARYPDPALRPFCDLDFLVDDPAAAHRALMAAGFVEVGDAGTL